MCNKSDVSGCSQPGRHCVDFLDKGTMQGAFTCARRLCEHANSCANGRGPRRASDLRKLNAPTWAPWLGIPAAAFDPGEPRVRCLASHAARPTVMQFVSQVPPTANHALSASGDSDQHSRNAEAGDNPCGSHRMQAMFSHSALADRRRDVYHVVVVRFQRVDKSTHFFPI